MSWKALIVDDEPLARERVRTLLRREPDFEAAGEAGDGREALRALTESSFDLVFLDVQMPEMDGFDVLETLGARRDVDPLLPAVVFVTAYDRFALRAFDVHAIDYLLKPFDGDRFARTMARVRSQLQQRSAGEMNEKLVSLLEGRGERDSVRPWQRFVVRSKGRTLFIDAEEIDWIEAAGNYVSLHVGPRDHLLRETMARIEERLDPARFARIHRSRIVKLDRVSELRPAERGYYEVRLRDGTRLAASRSYYGALAERLRARS